MNIRLFIGTFVNDAILSKDYEEIKSSFHNITFGKWVEHHNLHFTYNFLGDVDSEKLNAIKKTLCDDLRIYSSELVLAGLSVFPNIHNPRIMHVKVMDDKGILSEVYQSLASGLVSLGFATEKRKFLPHVTFQRIKSLDRTYFKKEMEQFSTNEFGTLNEFKVCLISSELTRNGPVYKVL